jgi:YfiH family protein
MKRRSFGAIVLYSFNHLEPWSELTQGAFTRQGGVSDPPYDSLNASFAVQDKPESVRTNRQLLARAVGWDPSRIVSAGQVHGRQAVAVGRGNLGGPDLVGTDALVTDEPGVLLMLKFADCVPVILWDPVRRVVGLAHAGWRGTILGTPGAALELMVGKYGSRPSDMLVGIGPSIGPCCYEVGPEVAEAAGRKFAGTDVLRRNGGGKLHLDLWGANAETLMRLGVPEENVATAAICTRCHHDLFFSHRAAGGLTGRFAFVAGIRDE